MCIGMYRLALRSLLVALAWSFVESQTCAPFTRSPQSVVVNPGEAVSLYCAYPTNTSAVTWDKGTSHAAIHDPYPCNCLLQQNGTASVLTFPSIGNGDFDIYSCNVQIGPGLTCTSNANVTKAVPPVLTAVGNTSQTVAQGSTVTFSVSLTNPGLPLANVVWSKGGVPLSNTSNMVVTSTTLQLSNIQVGDRGQYVATATNKAGSVSASFSLFVQYLEVDPIQVTGFSTVQLTCSARSYPAVTSMSWAPAQSTSTTTTNDGYLFTSSSVLTVPSDCARTYQCTVIQSVPMTTIKTAAVQACGGTVLNLVPVGVDGVFLVWNSAQGVPSYSLTYQPNGTTPRSISCQSARCNATIDGLTPGILYTFYLNYAQASVFSFITTGSGLSSITNVMVSQSGVVSWNGLAEAIGYLVYVNKDTPNAYVLNVTSTTMTTVATSCSMSLVIQVQAYSLSAFSNLSSPVTLTTKCAPVVKPVGSTSVLVEWTASGGTSSYVISYQISGTGGSQAMMTGLISCMGKCNYTLTGLTSGSVYNITIIRATGQAVTSTLLASVGSGLNGVTGLVATPSGNTAQLKWNAVANANGYLVYVNQTSTGASYIVTTSSVMHTVAITCGLPYTFAVQAYSDGGYSDVSPPVKLNSCETSSPIPQNLIIGVVVVGVLVLVASVFCGLGVWYACTSNSKDKGDARSVTSIEGVSPTTIQETDFSREEPATAVPTPNCNFLRSHKITWEHHSNTLRDLDRGGISV
ncbi:hypothetical protein EMCRGX_G028905 [Ephydatia muelleri]